MYFQLLFIFLISSQKNHSFMMKPEWISFSKGGFSQGAVNQVFFGFLCCFLDCIHSKIWAAFQRQTQPQAFQAGFSFRGELEHWQSTWEKKFCQFKLRFRRWWGQHRHGGHRSLTEVAKQDRYDKQIFPFICTNLTVKEESKAGAQQFHHLGAEREGGKREDPQHIFDAF